MNNKQYNAKPFLKWAGGKGQLLKSIARLLPKDIATQNFTYIEPFIGSGAVLFWMLAHFPNMKRAIINDINEDLTVCYHTIASYPHDLIAILEQWQREFHACEADLEQKKQLYYAKRNLYNTHTQDKLTQSALFIFLNRTCFNGLYRVNAQGLFNVPIGDYKKPKICDKDNLLSLSHLLKQVEILNGDFKQMLEFATPDSFLYLDPPYKPLSQTSHFNSYVKQGFDDSEQIRLHHFCQQLDERGSKWLLSNSDVSPQSHEDSFFDRLYVDFKIERVGARRRISARSSSRTLLNELLIRNYS